MRRWSGVEGKIYRHGEERARLGLIEATLLSDHTSGLRKKKNGGRRSPLPFQHDIIIMMFWESFLQGLKGIHMTRLSVPDGIDIYTCTCRKRAASEESQHE